MQPIFAFFLALWCFASPAFAETVIIYPAPESSADVRHADVIELLRVALAHTTASYGTFTMRPAASRMNKARQLVSLKNQTELSLVWSSTSLEMEAAFLPIRIPLRKGLLGYRIALIADDRQAEFDKVTTADDLKRYLIGQGNGWADVDVLRAADMRIETSNYDSLFKMVGAKRIDLFPRGLTEIFQEYEANKQAVENLAIEKSLVLRYDNPYYFFVNKDNAELARRLEDGLRMMIKDGSFDDIFWRYHGADIRRAGLDKRRVIHIANPLLSPETPLQDKSLWFNPSLPGPKR